MIIDKYFFRRQLHNLMDNMGQIVDIFKTTGTGTCSIDGWNAPNCGSFYSPTSLLLFDELNEP